MSSIAVASLKDGLLGYWNLDEADGKTAADSSGNGNDATLKGNGIQWKPNGGKLGGALEFDGGGDGAEDDNGADYINGLTAITGRSLGLSLLKLNLTEDLSTDATPVATIPSCRYDMMPPVFEAGGNDVVKAGITTTGGIQRLESSNDVQTDSWQHLALTWSSGNELALYIEW